MGATYQLSETDGWWTLSHRDRDVVGHHHPEMNKVVLDDTWVTMFKFDQVPRNLSDFQPKCDQYQDTQDPNNILLAKLPIAINKV